jgi:hypothetical protein
LIPYKLQCLFDCKRKLAHKRELPPTAQLRKSRAVIELASS